jgi:hypothetical protein
MMIEHQEQMLSSLRAHIKDDGKKPRNVLYYHDFKYLDI